MTRLKSLSQMAVTFLTMVAVSCAPPSSDNKEDFVPQKPVLSGEDLNNLGEYGDIIRDISQLDEVLKSPSLTSVTREYGLTVIPADRQLPYTSTVSVSTITPWSSWWYPKRESFLFYESEATGVTSVLSKYDFVRRLRYKKKPSGEPPGSAAEYERKNYNPHAITWEGLCDAWSLASIAKPEPKRPVTYTIGKNSVTFSVGELKSLLLLTYEAVEDTDLKYYGQKFTGGYESWIQPDIFPEQFHRFIEVQLIQKQQPFILDHDPGIEVWNNPVYKANYTISAIPNQPNAIFVRMWIYIAQSTLASEKDFIGTKETVREYNYVLTGERKNDHSLVINSGYWVKGPEGHDSRRDHPDYLIQLPRPEKIVRKSWNPEINVELIDEILEKSY